MADNRQMNLDKMKIAWITADYFLDVDIPIVPKISRYYSIDWYILIDSYNNINKEKINQIAQKYNLDVKFINIKSIWYSPAYFFEFYSFFKTLQRKNFNLIYINLSSLSYVYFAADLSLDKDKVIFATHNVVTPKGARWGMLAKINMYYLLRRFKNFHVFSKNQRKALMDQVSSKNLLFAPLALKDYGKAHNLSRDNTALINFLMFGHIRDYKRVDILINAAQLVYEETNIMFKVTIAGNCKDWSRYQALIKYPFLFNLKIGYIEDTEIPALFSEAHYLVLPYQDLAQSGAITVAFNYNIPVIVSDIIQFKEFVIEDVNGFFFISKSVVDLKEVIIKRLCMNYNDYMGLCNSVRKFVGDNYSLSSICDKYVEYFEFLLLRGK